MYTELSIQTIERIKEAIDRNNVLRTKDDVLKDYQDVIELLKDINKEIGDAKQKYEEHIEDTIYGIGEQV
jgi:hypothetical protein